MTTEELATLLHDSTCVCKTHNTHHYAEFEQMAAAILARYDLVEKWVPVEERLPKPSAEVLIWDGDYMEVDTFVGDFGEGPTWDCGHNGVTHWRPLPAAPQKV